MLLTCFIPRVSNLFIFFARVAETPACKMPVSNLARMFGPTIVGYSCPEPDPESALRQLKKQHSVRKYFVTKRIPLLSKVLLLFNADHGKVDAHPERLLVPLCRRGSREFLLHSCELPSSRSEQRNQVRSFHKFCLYASILITCACQLGVSKDVQHSFHPPT